MITGAYVLIFCIALIPKTLLSVRGFNRLVRRK